MYTRKDWENRIRMEAASQAIENTIQVVEDGLGTKFPRGSTPTERQEHYAEHPAIQTTLTCIAPMGQHGRCGYTAAKSLLRCSLLPSGLPQAH